LSILAQHLPKEELVQIRATASEIRDLEYRADVLSSLVQTLMHIPEKECYPHIETLLTQLALYTRTDLFSDISALLPILLHLGGEGLCRETLQAVRDVSAWWP
jgi:hypothetical protein